MPDLSVRELAMMVPLGLSVLWMGVYPESFLKPMRADVGVVLARLERAKPAGDSLLRIAAPRATATGEGATHGVVVHGETGR